MTIKWRKLPGMEQCWEWRRGIFSLVVCSYVWEFSVKTRHGWVEVKAQKCQTGVDGKRKASAWLEKQINKVVEG